MSRAPQKLTELIVFWLKGHGIDANVKVFWGCDLVIGAKYNINVWGPSPSKDCWVSIAYYDNDNLDPMEVMSFNHYDPGFFSKLAERLGL